MRLLLGILLALPAWASTLIPKDGTYRLHGQMSEKLQYVVAAGTKEELRLTVPLAKDLDGLASHINQWTRVTGVVKKTATGSFKLESVQRIELAPKATPNLDPHPAVFLGPAP